MMNNTISKDISTLTTIPESSINKLIMLTMKCISHEILECMKNGENICTADIGIGTLTINLTEEDLSFKFIPSIQFQNLILKTLDTKESDLVNFVESLITDKIVNTYKTLLI